MTRAALSLSDNELVAGEPLVAMTTNRNIQIANGELLRYGGLAGVDPDAPLHLPRIRVHNDDGERICYTDPAGFSQKTDQWREARREDVAAWRYRAGRSGEIKNPKWIRQAQAIADGDLPRTVPPGPAGEALHVHFGYCLTCHKMQGSEADNIGIAWAGTDPVSGSVWSNWFMLKQLDSARAWWYTAVTRAKRSVILWW